jgi:hypothetical protein
MRAMESQLVRKESERLNKERARGVELEEKMPVHDKRQREQAPLKAASAQAMAATANVPETLLVLESCLLDGIDCVHLLHQLHVPLLIIWESQSSILCDGLVDMKWWETQFNVSHPVTYERLVSSPKTVRTSGQGGDAIDRHNFWKGLLSCDLGDRRVWKETIQFGGVSWHARHAIQCSYADDEFGYDRVHQLLLSDDKGSSGRASERQPLLRTFSWNATSDDSVSESYFDFNKQPGITASHPSSSSLSFFTVAHMWTVPFRDACLVLLQDQNPSNNGNELVWVQTGVPMSSLSQVQDLRYWALNRNVFLEDSNDFVVPTTLGEVVSDADCSTSIPLMWMHPVLVCSTNDCTVVVLEGKICLIFDKSKMKSCHFTNVRHGNVRQKVHQESPISHWRHLLTDQFCEPLVECLVLTLKRRSQHVVTYWTSFFCWPRTMA